MRLPYAEVEAGQHKLKLYSPTPGALRFEIKVEKMQFLGRNHPQFLADLTNPDYLPALAAKLLKAFDRIMWKCPIADLDVLTTDECKLYLQGRDYTYWEVRQQDYDTSKEFRRQEKNRQREKEAYNAFINRHWQGELPARVRQRIEDQLNQYIDISHSGLYHTARELCIERWQLVRHLPPSS